MILMYLFGRQARWPSLRAVRKVIREKSPDHLVPKEKKKKIWSPSSKNTDLILLAFNSFAQLLIFLVSYSFQSKFGKTEKLLL